MKTIRLTQGKIALIDDEDYNHINQFKWYAHFEKNGRYSARRHKKMLNGKRKTIQMGREILGLVDSETEAHYKNGDMLDNRKSNLIIFKEVEVYY